MGDIMIVLKDISKKHWHETGGVPIKNLIENIENLVEAVNERESDITSLETFVGRYYGPGTISVVVDQPGTYNLLPGRKHPDLHLARVHAQVGSTSAEDSEIMVKLNNTGAEMIEPLTFKSTEKNGKVRKAVMRDNRPNIGRSETVDIVFEGNQIIVVTATFEPIGEK